MVSANHIENPMNLAQSTASVFALCTTSLCLALETDTSAPDFVLPTLESTSTTVQLSEQRGKVVLVDFWAAWCGPCRKSMPMLEELYQKHKDSGFTILAISLDDSIQTATRFASQFQTTYPLLIDSQADIADLYQVIGMPTSYLIDRDGKVIWKHQGFKPADMKKISQQVETALNEGKSN